MNHLLNILKAGLLALLPLLLKAHLITGLGGVISVAFPPLNGLLNGSTVALLGTVLYWLELAVRVIPTAKDYTPLAIIIQLLQAIVPNQATGPNGEPGVHENASFFQRLFHRRSSPVAEPDLVEPAPAASPSVTPELVQSLINQLAAATSPNGAVA